MSKIYEVRSIAKNDNKTHYWGACYSRPEAEELLASKTVGEKKEWADRYHNRWWVEEIDTTGMFEIPTLPAPRDRFSTTETTIKSTDGTWDTLKVDVHDSSGQILSSYQRNHPRLYRTFEPFRQGSRMLALISQDYTSTSVMDLETGEIIASEMPDETGFCPAGFYVPDWWDINDGSILPGSHYWDSDNEEPKGNFGIVWGCIWGDDGSWKVQYLDLAQVQSGKLTRDERFGYVELATNPKLDPKDFIECNFRDGKSRVTFSVLSTYDLNTGGLQNNDC